MSYHDLGILGAMFFGFLVGNMSGITICAMIFVVCDEAHNRISLWVLKKIFGEPKS